MVYPKQDLLTVDFLGQSCERQDGEWEINGASVFKTHVIDLLALRRRLQQKDEVSIVDVPRMEWEVIAAAFYLKLIRLRWNIEHDAIHGRIGHFKTPLDFPVPRIHDHEPDPVCRGRKSKPRGL